MATNPNVKTVWVRPATHSRIKRKFVYGDTFDSFITKLIDLYEQEEEKR